MILTHESGSQEDQFDEKKWRQKISWDYPFKERDVVVTCGHNVVCLFNSRAQQVAEMNHRVK
jgi:hypothetical protein